MNGKNVRVRLRTPCSIIKCNGFSAYNVVFREQDGEGGSNQKLRKDECQRVDGN